MSLAVGDRTSDDVTIKFVPLCPEKYVCRDCGMVRKGWMGGGGVELL